MIKRMRVCIYIICVIVFSMSVCVQVKAQKAVYTSLSGKGSLEDGTRENPYSSFEDAVANVADGDTIYILAGDDSYYGFINDPGEDKPFVIDKSIIIESEPGTNIAVLECRAAGILLEADVMFKNIQLNFANSYHDHIYANGYHLTLDNVTRNQGCRIIDLVAGGLFDVTTGDMVSENPGDAAKITIKGKNSYFGNIYAGGMNGAYTGNVTIELQDVSSTSVNEIYACGATEPDVNRDQFFDFGEPDYPAAQAELYPVSGTVDITLENSPVKYVYGAGSAGGTSVSYITRYLATGQTLDSIRQLTVVEGEVAPMILTASTSIEDQNVDLEIQEGGILNLSSIEALVVDDFVGGGTLVLATEGTVTINKTAIGTTAFDTVNGEMQEREYIKTPVASTATFTYSPEYEYRNWTLECQQSEEWKSWTAVEGECVYVSYYAVNYGDVTMGEVSILYEILLPGETAEGATAIPAPGYHFVKWVDYDTEEMVSTEATFIPQWETEHFDTYYYDAYFAPNSYCVQYSANGGSGTMGQQYFTYGVAQELIQCDYTREGYTFAGWNTKADGTGTNYSDLQAVSSLTTKQDGSIILYAQWKIKSSSGNTGDEGTESDSSDIRDFQQNTDFNHGNVTEIQVSKVTYNTVTLTWNAVSGATSYHIYRSTKENFGYEKVATVTVNNYTDKKLKTGKKYYYKVQACVGETQGELSDVVLGKPMLEKPNVKLSSQKNAVTIRLGKVKGAQGYEVYCSTKKNKGFKKITTTKKTSYKNSKLTSGKIYYYKVRAYRKVNGKRVYSSYSKVKSVKVK